MTKKKPVAYGMTKKKALARIASDKYSWSDLAEMLRAIAPQIRKIQSQSSKISKGVPLAILFGHCRRTANRLKGRPKGSTHEATAINLLREFGTSKKGQG